MSEVGIVYDVERSNKNHIKSILYRLQYNNNNILTIRFLYNILREYFHRLNE